MAILDYDDNAPKLYDKTFTSNSVLNSAINKALEPSEPSLVVQKYYYYLQPSQHIDGATEVVIVSHSKLVNYLKTTIFYAAALSEDIMIDDFLVVHWGAEAKINSNGNIEVEVKPDGTVGGTSVDT